MKAQRTISFSLRAEFYSALSQSRSLHVYFMWCDKCQRCKQGGWAVKQLGCWSVCAHWTPGSRHHLTRLSVLHLGFLYVWISALVPGSGLLTARRAEILRMGMQMVRRGLGWACYKAGHLLARAVTLRHSSLRYLLFSTDCGNPGLSVHDTSSKQACCSTWHWYKKIGISYVLGGSFWAEPFAVGTAHPALLLFSGVIPREELPPFFILLWFPAVVDHSWVMPRALFPSWSPAFIMDAFCVLQSPFFSSLTEIEKKQTGKKSLNPIFILTL